MPRPLSRLERERLCDTALEVGESEPTLCGDWNVKDLVVHLVVRERDPLGLPGIFVPPLESFTDLSARRVGRDDFPVLVEKVRSGPPLWWPTAVPPLDRAVNTLEFLVHHEDIRRAQPEWQPRTLSREEEDAVYRPLLVVARHVARSAGPLRVRRTDVAGARPHTLRRGKDPVTVTGTPSEIALFVYGRRPQSRVQLEGSDTALARLQRASLGL